MGSTYVWDHFGVGRHVDTDRSLIFEDVYNLKLDFRMFM